MRTKVNFYNAGLLLSFFLQQNFERRFELEEKFEML